MTISLWATASWSSLLNRQQSLLETSYTGNKLVTMARAIEFKVGIRFELFVLLLVQFIGLIEFQKSMTSSRAVQFTANCQKSGKLPAVYQSSCENLCRFST